MGREDLVEVLRHQIAMAAGRGQRLLAAHQERIGEAAQQHDERQDDVHDTDLLVVDRGQPFRVQVLPLLEPGDQAEREDGRTHHAGAGDHDDRLVPRHRIDAQLAENEINEGIGRSGHDQLFRSAVADRVWAGGATGVASACRHIFAPGTADCRAAIFMAVSVHSLPSAHLLRIWWNRVGSTAA